MVITSHFMAFDFGTWSIGVAIGQQVTCTANPLTTLKVHDGLSHWKKIEKLLNEWQPDMVVVGLPLNMDGSEQPLTARARKFANRLHGRFNIKVVMHDERLSTIETRAKLFALGGYRALDKGQVDAGSAVIILECWLKNTFKNNSNIQLPSSL
ncbi:Holliday junction resolvase RuvX [Sodalis endosymbiont of Henestaris halophilus]|uniref:Holliday junction resolvase RuvX n=1 Tax=Sodalis endosymbiont of Henestaris halophilus TaxID=1929246 RepID=UPI000BC0335E|nr:Holliday junction resolvase RuvX [Sodalis endosymbiont of Henestaris halophilus]SNC58622.1 Putative Holliday junction resolvase [Sodalis endosymbiont of Henestaris halophilus]